MGKICGYEVIVTFVMENGDGVALGHDPQAVMPYVTWLCHQNKTNPRRHYDWPCYSPDREMGEADLVKRVRDYQRRFNVKVKCVEALVPDNPGLGWDGPRPILEQLAAAEAEAARLAQDHRAEPGNAKTAPDKGGDR